MPALPYVSAAAFKAHPTYLDLDDLRSGSENPGDQTAELTNVLLMASAWADGQAQQRLGAHPATQRLRQRLDRYGQLSVHAERNPVRTVTAIAWGYTPSPLTALSDLSQLWIEDNRQIIAQLAEASIPASAGIQFGGAGPGYDLFIQLHYTAGWVATVLGADAAQGAMSLTVADPVGIEPGGEYRIWEPGAEETVTVAQSWVPTAATAPASVPLASGTVFAHTSGHDFSGMPADMRLAVINYAISQLMRPDTAAEDAYPDTSLGSGTRQNDPRQDGSGLVAEAARILVRYARVR